MIETTDQILLMAFRYALPRNTSAPDTVVTELLLHWDKLPEWMREQICEDIRKQRSLAVRSSSHDYSDDWDQILALNEGRNSPLA